MDLASIITDVINIIPWKVLTGMFFGAIFIGVLKRYYDNVSSFLMFRSNKDLGKNVKVLVNGKEGFIIQVTWRFIYVRLTESGNELVIPITKWTNQSWEIFKNGNTRKK
jgi:hypothetical protein